MSALGRHIIAELYECEAEKIDDVSFVEKIMLAAAENAGATVINSTFHHFSPFGVSGVIVIQESHFSVHCWPEYRYASIDIYTCGDTVNPWLAYEYLKSAFGADHGSAIELNRGQSNLLKNTEKATLKDKLQNDRREIKASRDIWFTERNDNIALSVKHSGERLYYHNSPFQKIEIFQTEAFGKILVLDGKIVCAEEDEYVYHEMIAHVPVFAHPNPKNVLVIGGGDGGTVRELLKHKNIESVKIIEIDECVPEATKEYMPQLASGLSSDRVILKVEDGVKYVKNSKAGVYDIVIVDSDGPSGPGEGLFSEQFYLDIYRILKDEGIMITQSESPRYNRHIFKEVFGRYQKIYKPENVYCYLMYLPSFPSGMWSFSFSAKGDIDPFKNLSQNAVDLFSVDGQLKYYNYEMHHASFVLPPFVRSMIDYKGLK